MKVKRLLFLILFSLGQMVTFAQEKIKFRFGFNSVHSATHYDDAHVSATEYFTLSKYPLTNFNRPPIILINNRPSFIRTIAYNFSFEKKISEKNIVSIGVVLNDAIEIGHLINSILTFDF